MSEISPRKLPPVRRRRSPLDPVAGTWAVVGCGATGAAALHALRSHGVPALGYDAGDPAITAPPPEVRWEHRVMAVEEVEDVDQLAVTSEDVVSGEINTDYVAGVVIAVPGSSGWSFADDELMNVHGEAPRLAHGMFTPRHPGVVVVAGTPDLSLACELAGAYAAALWRRPREALGFHRFVCEPYLPGWPLAAPQPVTAAELRHDLAALTALRGHDA